MAKGIYVASAEPSSYKSIVVLGMMELLCNQDLRVCFFKPVVANDAEHDPTIRLISQRYKLGPSSKSMHGVTHETATKLLASDQYDELITRIIEKYRALEAKYDVIVCAGSSFRSPSSPLEFDFNIDVANNLGCLLMPVVRGYGRSLAEISESLVAIVDGLEKEKMRRSLYRH